MLFQALQPLNPKPGMAVQPMNAQRTAHLPLWAFIHHSVHLMIGRKAPDLMAAPPESRHYCVANHFVPADIMRRIEIGQDKNFHASSFRYISQPARKPASLPQRCCQRIRAAWTN